MSVVDEILERGGPEAALLMHLIERGVLRVPDAAKVRAPNVHELVDHVDLVVEDVMDTLVKRGKQYGEDVLVEMGERGIAVLCLIKVRRMLWNLDQGRSFEEREDGWRDLAGYALLAPAMEAWKKGNQDG